jgi:L-ascorbate 6-phosphate lactonase
VDDRSPLGRLRDVRPPEGVLALAWLGQAGFVVRSGNAIALVDPFLAPYEGRGYESSVSPERAEGVDVVLCTHEHVDHFDADSAPAIAKASPGAVFVVPTPIVDMVTEAGVSREQVAGIQPGEVLEVADLTIRAVPAMHGVTMEDAYGFGEELSGGLVRFVGFVVDAADIRLYHAGDTIHFPGMEDTLQDLSVDLAMLPINGRDPGREARGIVGNLTEREAAWLAGAIGTGTVVPMHYDLFAGNRGYPSRLVESVERDHPGVHVLVPTRDRPFVWSAGKTR